MNLKSLSGTVLGRVQMRDSQLRETPFATREEKVSGGIFTATRTNTESDVYDQTARAAPPPPLSQCCGDVQHKFPLNYCILLLLIACEGL
jgi:hypothetical protein